MTYVLVLFLHAGMLSQKDSMAMTTVPGFKTEASCLAAGKASEDLGKRTTKEVKFVCLKQD
jgi:hypothetical protein